MPRDGKGVASNLNVVTASEIAEFVYCQEKWRLEFGLGLEPRNRAALGAGTRHNARKAFAERMAGALIGVGRILAILAAFLLMMPRWRWT